MKCSFNGSSKEFTIDKMRKSNKIHTYIVTVYISSGQKSSRG